MSAETLPAWKFRQFVEAEADGYATPDELAVLEADRNRWGTELRQLLEDAEEFVASARALQGDEREQVLADAQADHRRFTTAWARFNGIERPANGGGDGDGGRKKGKQRSEPEAPPVPGVVRLQVSWEPGRVVAWAAGPHTEAADADEVLEMLEAAGAPTAVWIHHPAVRLPGGVTAEAFEAPVGDILGWLVAVGAGRVGTEAGASVRWLGRIAVWAVELTARGAMVPLLHQRKRRTGRDSGVNASFTVRWTPASVDPRRLKEMAAEVPGSVLAMDTSVDARAVTRSALAGMVNAICRDAAGRIEVPAAPPTVRTGSDVTEAFLARLDGSAFDAPVRVASDIMTRTAHWARSVTGDHAPLVVRLDPPDRGDAWELEVFAAGAKGSLVPVERAIVDAGSGGGVLEDQLARVERILPALLRPGSNRGRVVLDQEEAWDLMANTGSVLADAGFDVRIPELARHRATPTLRVFAETPASPVAGAAQLADVRWSVVFDDVELTAADIKQLAREARPLIRSGGKWVAIDRVDLDAAAAALAERASTTQLSGADMLRLALGLEGSPLAGGFSVEGGGWAADLLEAARNLSTRPAVTPEGFAGELRSYQTDALTWLEFLTSAGIGGCLALDMGLGKTPTTIASLLLAAGTGPSLVIAPAAVVGNWAGEAAKFAPGLRVAVHHGANRASVGELAALAANTDLVITTYGTAVRDVEALAEIEWSHLVLDEAQAIKNPTSETAQQLRRLRARTRVALTGTPIENGLGDLWAILDFTNPGLVGPRAQFVAQLSAEGDGPKTAESAAESALRALNGILVFRRTKAEPAIAAELPDRIDELDHCAMTQEQIGLYQAVLDQLVVGADLPEGEEPRKGQILAAITALKQICNHPAAYVDDDLPLAGRSGKLARLEEIVESVFAADERVLVFTHFAEWGQKLAAHLTEVTGVPVECYHGGLSRTARDQIVEEFQAGKGKGALVLSLKAGGTGLNLTAANHVVLYDRWWNPAVEDQARDRAWRIGQTHTVISHRLVCPGTIDERVEEVVAGKRHIANLVLPKSSSLADLDTEQLRAALGISPDALLTDELLTEEQLADDLTLIEEPV
ncbi:MAG: DEAD/DEAH box helicase [Acidimicrobiia bacterium]